MWEMKDRRAHTKQGRNTAPFGGTRQLVDWARPILQKIRFFHGHVLYTDTKGREYLRLSPFASEARSQNSLLAKIAEYRQPHPVAGEICIDLGASVSDGSLCLHLASTKPRLSTCLKQRERNERKKKKHESVPWRCRPKTPLSAIERGPTRRERVWRSKTKRWRRRERRSPKPKLGWGLGFWRAPVVGSAIAWSCSSTRAFAFSALARWRCAAFLAGISTIRTRVFFLLSDLSFFASDTPRDVASLTPNEDTHAPVRDRGG